MLITNTPYGVIVDKQPTNPIAIYAIEAYAFILPYNKIHTALEFANLIPQVYDASEPHTAEVIRTLKEIDRIENMKADREAFALGYLEAIIKSKKGD